jgi:hypothetical protein
MNDLLSAAVNAHAGLSRVAQLTRLQEPKMQHQSRIQTQKRETYQ